MEAPCTFCGHPGPFVPTLLPDPDPRVGLVVRCATCDRDITYDTHQWQSDRDDRYVCCSCMAPMKGLRDPRSVFPK